MFACCISNLMVGLVMVAASSSAQADQPTWMALLQQAQELESLQRLTEAEQRYRQILTPPRPGSLNDPMLQVVRLQLGENLKSQGRFDDAIAALNEIPRTDRDYSLRADAALRDLRQLRAQSATAVRRGLDRIRRDWQSPWGYRDLIDGLELAGQGAQALVIAQLQLGATFGADQALQLAQAAADTARWSLAIELHWQALRQFPDDPRLRPVLLSQLGSHGAPEQAIAAYLEALGHAPEDLQLRQALAAQYERAGDTPAAIEIYVDLIKQQPTHTSTYLLLGAALEDRSEWEAAVTVYLQSIRQMPEAGPSDPRRHAPRASAYQSLVRLLAQRQQLKRLLDLPPPEPAAIYYQHLALALEYQGQAELASTLRARIR